MQLNLTILAQVGNFLIAYYIFSRLFLRPVLGIILQEEALHQQLEEAIVKAQKELINKERELQDVDYAAQVKFHDEAPVEVALHEGDQALPDLAPRAALSASESQEIVRLLRDEILRQVMK